MKLLSSPYMLAVISIVYMIGSSIQQSFFPTADPPALVTAAERSPSSVPQVPNEFLHHPVFSTQNVQPAATASLVNLKMTVPPQSPVLAEPAVQTNAAPARDSIVITAGLNPAQEDPFLEDQGFQASLK